MSDYKVELPSLPEHAVNALLGQIKLQLSAAARSWGSGETRIDFRRQNTDKDLRCALRELDRLRDRVAMALAHTRRMEAGQLRQPLPGFDDPAMYQPVSKTSLLDDAQREGKDATRAAD